MGRHPRTAQRRHSHHLTAVPGDGVRGARCPAPPRRALATPARAVSGLWARVVHGDEAERAAR